MNDPLFSNKVAFSVLAAMLLFFGLPQLADALIGTGGHGGHGGALKLAYPIEYATEGAGAEGAAGAADLGTLLAAATPAAGQRRAALCTSCHNFEKGGANLQGPNLYGVVGRPVAKAGGFKYSGALQGLGGAWTYERLDAFVQSPAKYAPGTLMSFAGIGKPEQRAELLAYLATLSDAPVAFPAPAPPAEAAAAGADPAETPPAENPG